MRVAAYKGTRSAAVNAARVWNKKGHPLSGMGFRYAAKLVDGRHAVVSVKS